MTELPPSASHRGRLEWWRPAELDETRRALYDEIVGGPRAAGPQAFRLADGEGRLEGPFNAFLLDPPVGRVVQAVGAALRFESALFPREREVAVLELAYHRRSEFEWYAHERVGRAAGLDEGELAALRTGGPCATLSAGEQSARRVTERLCSVRDMDDETFADAVATLGEVKLGDLVVLVGYYDLLALLLATWRVPLPDGVLGAWDAAGDSREDSRAPGGATSPPPA
ncbi:MAG TPA: carboxymuconolactone decarboxylase family protein [Acidimicrobiales bacterium]|nr:carboxymuconolactone decarboxylase family protein [Acidimicrobiales bacterium]